MKKEELNQPSGGYTYPEHNCGDYHNQSWQNREDYNLIKCDICGNILKFRYKSFWRQLKMLFWNRIH